MCIRDRELMDRNIQEIEKYLVENNIKEVWGAWGNDSNIDMLIKGCLLYTSNMEQGC